MFLKEIDSLKYEKLFSVCILTARQDELESVSSSFYKAGFTEENSEYLYIDNIGQNKYDAYDGYNQFLNKSNGEYIILAHQDLVLEFDDIEILKQRIEEMNKLDPNWAILGNCGFSKDNINKRFTRITDPGVDNLKEGPFPSKVGSLDENFLVVKNDANLCLSKNIGHYHLYGTDLCIQAQNQGFTTYVIDFHLRHKSGGFPNQSFYDTKDRFISQYQNAFESRFVRTPCTIMYISNNKFLNKLMNRKFIYSIKKRIDKIKGK
ncbi:MAG: acyl esterase [Arcobacter sp.]|nr:MAG: acyl esterase [Arcobacter sp.]